MQKLSFWDQAYDPVRILGTRPAPVKERTRNRAEFHYQRGQQVTPVPSLLAGKQNLHEARLRIRRKSLKHLGNRLVLSLPLTPKGWAARGWAE